MLLWRACPPIGLTPSPVLATRHGTAAVVPWHDTAPVVAPLAGAKTHMNSESPRTTKLYDRTGDEITLDEVERIAI